MNNLSPHSFHIPVMGLGFTIDTPLKVGRFGISSTLSIIEDNLIEQMREFYSVKHGLEYKPILKSEYDFRAKRITSYLDLLDLILKKQMKDLLEQPFNAASELDKYFLMLDDNSFLKLLYKTMLLTAPGNEKKALEAELRKRVQPGSIDVNIMTKCDRLDPAFTGESANLFSDALSALRGFAQSNLESSIVFSAGLNPRLFSYCESFEDFYPKDQQLPRKKIVIKVSDFRSAMIQGKFLAKKGLLVSEFRIESGLNCGGHAFPTDGFLLGPIMEEFKAKREDLRAELFSMCNKALESKNRTTYSSMPPLRFTVQGGIGTTAEHKFLIEHYNVDSTGWGSPFLLVPEATNVDDETLTSLSTASPSDYFLSYSSPLGVAFNNFKKSSSEAQRQKRIQKNRPGSPCYKKFLSFNTEFTKEPICLASRQYQDLKIKQLKSSGLPADELSSEIAKVVEKDCLCEGLAITPVITNNILKPKQLRAVAICPGPNLAFFSGVFSLRQMIDHIYGRHNVLNIHKRPHMFINELKMYCDYLQKEVLKKRTLSDNKYFQEFRTNLLDGINYYRKLFSLNANGAFNRSIAELDAFEKLLMELFSTHIIPV